MTMATICNNYRNSEFRKLVWYHRTATNLWHIRNWCTWTKRSVPIY